ncbi:aminoglycoside phosphotransferase family protein [Brachybacterium sp. AOP43-C2-M15]|uniref:aminoglycoside phosphotransferase family protein n=1 Tax=Brachybacterium sp. AOP43-C2-M15 TaxID=3457661 RepID=UPI00403364DE
MHPDEVVALVRARPWAGRPWACDLVESFPARLRAALGRWELTVVRAFTEGAELPVLEVHGPDAGPAVLKLGGHGSDHSQQVRLLRAADGRGYVRVLDHAEDLEATLLERLGAPLHATVPDPEAEADALADLLPATWDLPTSVGLPLDPAQKATSLLTLIDGVLEGTEDGHRPVLDRARGLALALIEDPSPRQVVLHGDPHAGNALRRGPEHVLIDPDGFLGEPEYDAGVALRDHQQLIVELERQEPGAGRRRHAGLVTRTAQRLALDPDRITAWAHLERVTTGIHLRGLGWTQEGESWLRTAQRLLL